MDGVDSRKDTIPQHTKINKYQYILTWRGDNIDEYEGFDRISSYVQRYPCLACSLIAQLPEENERINGGRMKVAGSPRVGTYFSN